jgi:hypothetical protein
MLFCCLLFDVFSFVMWQRARGRQKKPSCRGFPTSTTCSATSSRKGTGKRRSCWRKVWPMWPCCCLQMPELLFQGGAGRHVPMTLVMSGRYGQASMSLLDALEKPQVLWSTICCQGMFSNPACGTMLVKGDKNVSFAGWNLITNHCVSSLHFMDLMLLTSLTTLPLHA